MAKKDLETDFMSVLFDKSNETKIWYCLTAFFRFAVNYLDVVRLSLKGALAD